MPEYLAPGVYVEEVDTGSKPIEGVSTSTAGFVGVTERGPDTGLPVLVTSFSDFTRKFGGYFDYGSTWKGHNCLPYAVEGFFANGGKRLYVMRVAPSTASEAETTAKGGLVTRLTASTSKDATNDSNKKLRTATLRGIRVGTKLKLRMVKDSVITESADLTVASIASDGEITLGGAISTTVEYDARYTSVLTNISGIDPAGTITVLTNITDSRPVTFKVKAKDKGRWGKRLLVRAFHQSPARVQFDSLISGAVDDDIKIRLKSSAGFYVNAWVEIEKAGGKRYRKVKAVDGTVITLWGGAMLITDFDVGTTLAVAEFGLEVTYRDVVERFDGLTLENVPGRYYLDRVNNRSSLITLAAPPTATNPFFFPSGDDGSFIVLDTNGSDGTSPPADSEYRGTDGGPGKRTGLKALEDIDQVSILAAPGVASQTVQNAMIEQCERLKDRFAILDPLPKSGDAAPDMNDVQTQRNLYDSKYAAIYYPRLKVYDPLTDLDIPLPPSGHMAGIYARSDIERGVHKAPANEVIRGITGLELSLNKAEHDILNPSPANINVLRDFRSAGRGYRVWGGRCITSDPDWKYVNVRRLFIFIEESIEKGTQWVVFEPNDEPLWARVRRSVSGFLRGVWRDGALQGATPEQAFFVKCDRSTMSQADIDNGRLIMLIGIAPVKPAEFVIFRIGQWAGGSAVEE